MEHSEIKLLWITENSEGKCPKCRQSGMILIKGKDGVFFGCSKYFTKGCKGTERLKKQDFLDIIEMWKHKEFVEIEASNLSGLMDAYPEWDPDKEDIDSYLDN